MSMNTSQRKMNAMAMETPLLAWKGGRLILHCPRCRATRALPITRLCEQIGEDQRLGPVLRRLRCATPGCGVAPSAAAIEGPPRPGSSVPFTTVKLIGPGAYG